MVNRLIWLLPSFPFFWTYVHVANKSAKQLLEKERALTFGLITDCIFWDMYVQCYITCV